MSGLERTREALRIGERDTTAWDAAWAEVERAEAVIQAAREYLPDYAIHADCTPPSDPEATDGPEWAFELGCSLQPLAAALRALDEDTP